MATHNRNNGSNGNNGNAQQQPQGRPSLSIQTTIPQSQSQDPLFTSPTTPSTAGPAGGMAKKRKGARSVSSLTPAQLERKRANDREAQRAIRARTKENIERLERQVKGNQQTINDINRENYQLKVELHHLKAEVKHLREKHNDNEVYMTPYEPMSSAPTPTPGRVSSSTSSLFLSQPVTPSDTRPPPSYGILNSDGSHFGSPEDTSPAGPTYVTSLGDHGEWSSTLLHNPLQCGLPSPTSAGGNSASSMDGPSFMSNTNPCQAMDSMGPMIRTPQPDGLDLDDMRTDIGYGPTASLSPSPGVGDHSQFDGGHSPLGSLTSCQLQQTNSPYLHQPHPQHFNSTVSFGQAGPFHQPPGSQHLYAAGSYYSPVSRSPVPM